MKKVISLILMVMLAICSIGLVACDANALFDSITGNHRHTFGEGVQTTAPTCTKNGVMSYACTGEDCDATKKEDIPALGHALVFYSQTEPTCTENGVKKFKCLRKDCPNGIVLEEIPALGHDLKSYEGLPATCTKDGYDAYVECLRDGCNHTTYNQQAALGHDYDSQDKCVACGSIDHDHVYDIAVSSVILAPTCTEVGQRLYACTLDGCTETEVGEIDALGHTFDEGVQTLAPTCLNKGSKLFTCTIAGCNGTKTEPIDELGHDLEYFDAKPATCEEDGYYDYEICHRDNCNHNTYEVEPAKGHDVYQSNEKLYCNDCDYSSDPIATILSTDLTVNNSIYYGNNIPFKDGKVVTTDGEEVKGVWSVDDSEVRLMPCNDLQSSKTLTATLTATFTPNSCLYEPVTTEVDISYEAVAKYDSKYYVTLDGALTAANEKGGTVTVVVEGDYYDKQTANTITISEIKSGVTLSIPWAGENESVNGYTASSKASVKDARVLGLVYSENLGHAFNKQANYLKSLVIINSNLTNNGTINIGGVISGKQGDVVASQTAKYHAELDLGENVTLTNKGKINCYGYIDELRVDTAKIENYGTIEAPFSITEHRGGSIFAGYKNSLDNSFTSSSGGASPFNRFFLLNIFAKTIHKSDSNFNGYVDLYAKNTHNESIINLIATSNNESLINLASGAVLETNVDRSTLVNTMDFYGSFTLNPLEISLSLSITSVDINTKNVLLPISWYFNVNMHKFKDDSASSVNLSQNIKLLPGAKMVIDRGVTVTADYMAVYKEFPTSTSCIGAGSYFSLNSAYVQYEKAYYNIPAELIVNGTLNVNTIGGTVKTTEDGAILNVKSGVSAIIREIDYTTSSWGQTKLIFTKDDIYLTLPTLSGEEIVYTESKVVGEYVSSNGAFALKTN